ncbi:MAG: alkaline phosphatase [Bacteroidaceae bacterium]|nr:alkaline phosphatase [Bacteroidaceae bacterium]
MRNLRFIALALAMCICRTGYVTAQDIQNVKPVKNLIILIPDGCSLASVSTARWYQWMQNPDMPKLSIDPYLCGTVRTTCSNAPIGDSAPTTSCYMTGYPSLKGWVSTYPIAHPESDIYPMDSARAYQPLTTLLEATRLMMGKSIGLVSTCVFNHATPADCTSHCYNRNNGLAIANQMIHNGIDVLIGGGTRMVTPELQSFLTDNGWAVLKDDAAGMRTCDSRKMWALFRPNDMSYDIDRDPQKEPSLAEMTQVAIRHLSQDEDGFVIMVEGSEVDFAAHDNDPIGIVTEFLAFDRACKVALDFAKQNGETAVVILPDHGNSGLSIGRRDNGNYAGTPKQDLFGALHKMKASSGAVARRLNSAPFEQAQDIFQELCGFKLTDKELEALKNHKGYGSSPIKREDRKPVAGYNSSFNRMIAQFMTERTGLAFTTNGHTGEDVFLAAYHPDNASRPSGMLTNVELNHYLCSVTGLTHDILDSLTNANFAPHADVFKDIKGLKTTMDSKSLTLKYKKNTIVFTPNTNVVTVNGKEEIIPTVVVYVDKNQTYYVPRAFRERILAKNK